MVKVNKKAQVSFFIVISLSILIIAGIVFFVQKEEVKAPIEKEADKQPEFAGQTELKNYVDSCLLDVSLQGLEILRLQGGYIDFPENIQTLTVKDKENKQIKTIDGSKKVVIDADGEGNKVPFWLTKDSLAIPSIGLMESQLKKYINLELNKCINDFNPFREQKFQISYGTITPEVILENAATIKINFPINVSKDDLSFGLKDFILTIPIDFRLIIDRATDITGFEDTFKFLEEHTNNLISLYSGIDSELLPPFSQSLTSFDCKSERWNKQDVQQRLKAVFDRNVKNLKIENTNYEKINFDDPFSQGVHESFVYEFFGQNYPTLSIDFSYRPEWEFIDYDIKPSLGDSLLPHTVRKKIPFVGTICVFEYDYKYTIDYPVFVEVTDNKSASIQPEANVYLEKQGYKFQFLLDSYICGNQKKNMH